MCLFSVLPQTIYPLETYPYISVTFNYIGCRMAPTSSERNDYISIIVMMDTIFDAILFMFTILMFHIYWSASPSEFEDEAKYIQMRTWVNRWTIYFACYINIGKNVIPYVLATFKLVTVLVIWTVCAGLFQVMITFWYIVDARRISKEMNRYPCTDYVNVCAMYDILDISVITIALSFMWALLQLYVILKDITRGCYGSLTAGAWRARNIHGLSVITSTQQSVSNN
jgi:hypothetical protein